MVDIIIVGAGPAGMTAAIYAARAGLTVKLLESEMYGGQMTSTAEVANFPAVKKMPGWQLAQTIYEQIAEMGISVDFENAQSVTRISDGFAVKTSAGEYTTKTVVLATGAKRRHLNIPGENEFSGKGVSYCAICDGAFFKDKTACVIGGGNTALEDAAYLSNVCNKVYLVHRRGEFRGESHLINPVLEKENIEVLYNSEPVSITGKDAVTSIRIKSLNDGSEQDIATDAVFIAIGLEPQNKAFADLVSTDDYGYIIADETCRTSTPGIFAAGDARTKALRQIITAASDGASAAKQASEYINSQK